MKSAKITITFVPHGYQLDYDDGSGEVATECRDFSDDLDVEMCASWIIMQVNAIREAA